MSETFNQLVQEQANLYRLQEFVDHAITGIARGGPRFELTEALIKRMHSIATDGLPHKPGDYRTCAVQITNSNHKPCNWLDVPAQMGTLVRYVSEHWDTRSLIHLSAFVMWRLNWIHPFENGNGRTTRATAYLVLCAKHGQLLPAQNSIIEQIVRDRKPYYDALRAADDIFLTTSEVDVTAMENLLSQLLLDQLKASVS